MANTHPLVKKLQEAYARVQQHSAYYYRHGGSDIEARRARGAYGLAEDAIRGELVRLAGEDLVNAFEEITRDHAHWSGQGW